MAEAISFDEMSSQGDEVSADEMFSQTTDTSDQITAEDLAAVKRGEITIEQLQEAQGAFKDKRSTLRKFGGTAKGLGKAAASGLIDMADLAGQGVVGLSHVVATGNVKQLGATFEQGRAAAADVAQTIKNFATEVTGISLNPKDSDDKAAHALLAVLPEAIQAAGDMAFEKTGTPAAGAVTQGLLTLLTLKPGVVSSAFRTVKGRLAFKKLADMQPEIAEKVADHAGKDDSKLGEELKQEVAETKDINSLMDEAVMQEKPRVRVVGETVEGKPIVRMVTQQEMSTKIQNETAAARALLDEPLSYEELYAEMLKPVKGKVKDVVQNNASGESSASLEAIARVRQESKAGQYRYKISEDGTVTPLTGVDAVDITAKPGEVIVQRGIGDNEYSVIDRGGKPREAAVRTMNSAMAELQKQTNEKLTAKAAELNDPVVFSADNQLVTRKAVQHAFDFGSKITQTSALEPITNKLTSYYDQLIRTINPEALGKEAKMSAAVLAKNIAEQMQKDSQFTHRAATRRAFWSSRLGQARDFVKKFETGEKQAEPLLDQVAEGYKKWNEDIYKTDQAAGIKYDPVDNYLYHTFEDGPRVAQFLESRFGPKWNDPGFIKDRSFDMYEEAVKAGYKPKFTNPEDIMLARQHASDVAQMRVETLNDLQKFGLARKVKKGEIGRPADFPSIQWRSPTGERFWVHENASAVMHNAFETKSLWSMEGIGGDAFRGAMALKNTIVPIKLALSLFHPLHVITIDNATAMTRASKELLSGEMSPGKWIAEMSKASLYKGLIDNPRGGYDILKAYRGKVPDAQMTDVQRQALQYMSEGGMIPEMSAQYKTNAIQNFKDSVRQGSVKAAFHLPFAALSALQKPMFEIWIPSLKIASYLKDVQTAIKVDPSLLNDAGKRMLTFRKLSKSVDNRYGEMAYNTLFWNRMVKDLAVANTLSLGWQMGFIREYGGGMMDLGQVITKEGSIAQKAKAGTLDRPLFVSYYTAQALAYGGLLTWALSGEAPSSLMDYVFPKSGDKNAKGEDERVNTMFYPREIAAIEKHMEHEGVISGLGHLAASKSSGVIGQVAEWATGLNRFGEEIRDPNAPLYKQLEQTLAATLIDVEPISMATAAKSGWNPKNTALAATGFSPAPKYITTTDTEAAIRSDYQKYYSAEMTPYDKAQFSKVSRDLRQAYEKGEMDKVSELFDKLQTDYDLSAADQIKLSKKLMAGVDPTLTMFERMDWKIQKRLLDKMTQDERDIYLPRSNKQHLRYSYEEPQK